MIQIKKLEKQTKNAAKQVSINPTVDSLNNSTFFSAYEQAKTILDTGADLDDQLWAKLIKCRILDLKKEIQIRTINKPVRKINCIIKQNLLFLLVTVIITRSCSCS